MKIAAIYWPTSSVGGINTELVNLRKAAEAVGDRFDVLVSANQKTKRPGLFPQPKLIRGGDTFITVHGEAPHHPKNVGDTLDWIRENYDAIYFAYLCPHPNKAYGNEPNWIPLYRDTGLPIVSRITDGYWDTYAEWGKAALQYPRLTQVSNIAYGRPLEEAGLPVRSSTFPHWFEPLAENRSDDPLLVWTSQQKAIKSFHRFLPTVPDLKAKVEIYSCGILYYQLRSGDDWKRAIRKDHFKGYDGRGHADYFGYVPLDRMPEILGRSWAMTDYQGMGRPKNRAYTQGSYNNTTIEALAYGSVPVLAEQARLSAIPPDLFFTVEDAADLPGRLSEVWEMSLDPDRRTRARKWVEEHHGADKVYREIKEALS